MFHWNSLDIQDFIPNFIPKGGWNRTFSEQDKITCTTLFFFFKNKGFKEDISEILAHMVLFKQKYHIKYSEEQEVILKEALTPIIPVLITRKKH